MTNKSWAEYTAMYIDKKEGIVREEETAPIETEAEADDAQPLEESNSALQFFKNHVRGKKGALTRKERKLAQEEVENLDEISKDMAISYKHKAARQIKNNGKRIDGLMAKANVAAEKGDTDGARDNQVKAYDKLNQTWKRREGIEKANKILNKEEVELISEISQKVLKKYKEKATDDYFKRDDDQQKSMSKYVKTGEISNLHDYENSEIKKQAREKGIKRAAARLRKEEVDLDEGARGTFRAGSKSYFNAGQQVAKNIRRAAAERRKKEAEAAAKGSDPETPKVNEETLAELTLKTLQKYRNKARKEGEVAADASHRAPHGSEHKRNLIKKSIKRDAGVKLATKKLNQKREAGEK